LGNYALLFPCPTSIQQEARQILDALAFNPFERCQPISRDFDTIPTRVGLYAFRHRSEGLLYIGKAKNLRDRLRGGHKAFLWSWLDRYDPDDVRIAYVTLNQWQRPGLSYELETLILQATNPPYNIKIPRQL
jgi:excinuclease UvrABC nuclease subunit